MPKVTIIIPSYNHSQFLLDRLETIANQTYKDWEAIIIDDNSLDNSVEIIKKFLRENQYFKVKHFINNKSNSGSGYYSWQKGIELARSKYIWIAETDDFSHPNFLKESVDILEANELATLVFCTSSYVNEKGEFLYDSQIRTQDLKARVGDFKIFNSDQFLSKMPFKPYITNGSSVIFKKPEKAIPAELFTFKQSSDQFLWTYLIQGNTVAFLNKKLNYFRRHKDSTTNILSDRKFQKSVFAEKVGYINYFKRQESITLFLKNYIKFYVRQNKKDIFNTSLISNLKGKSWVRLTYYAVLIKFALTKLYKKN